MDHQRPKKGELLSNEQITAEKVQLIDEQGQNKGVLETREALHLARDVGLDLVEISPHVVPPVCKIMDLGKHKYVNQKSKNLSRKKHKTTDLKEVKVRPNIDQNDYNIKLRNIRRFLETGDKVKLTLRFRGREMAHQHLGLDVLMRLKTALEDISKVEQAPNMEGRQMVMVLSPRP